METYCSTSLANERAIPSLVFLREFQVIVSPHGKSKNQEDHRRKEDVHLQGKSSHWWSTGRDENDVSEKSGERHDQGPKNQPYVGPLPWWAENLRKLCPVNALRNRFANNQTRTFAAEQKRAETSSRVYVRAALLVG